LTDEAIGKYKRLPVISFDDRRKILESIKWVSRVVVQKNLNYRENLLKIKPDFVVHGDDWKNGRQKKIRDEVIKIISKWGGKVIDLPYNKKYSSEKYKSLLAQYETPTISRKKSLKRLIDAKNFIRLIDVHNGLSGLIAEKINIKKKYNVIEFDGFWASSLTNSTIKGKPDIEAVDVTERIQTINEILEVTSKPILFDADTGGKIEHFVFTVKTLERLGVSGLIVEDKIGLKKNSLLGNKVKQKQDSISSFSKKIKSAQLSKKSKEFLIIARIESLILGKSVNDCLARAKSYIDAGADGIMIQSKEKSIKKIELFCKSYNKFRNRKPLVLVPTAYSHVREEKLQKMGANVVIYANHLLRSAYPSMINTAKMILNNRRSHEVEKKILSIKDILDLIPGTN
tara:strand:+ start:423 stop:1619 length:1197 start_codon:yes stop_codon:yes gene_type:complete